MLEAMDEALKRYARQVACPRVGEEGQKRLLGSTAAIVGMGATGGAIASILVRAGVGNVRVIDRDLVEEVNLQRQMLFDERDARDGIPKAVAAERRLREANSGVRVQGVVADLTSSNVERLLEGATCIFDGTDNFETRLLVNDFAVSAGTPWIYAGVIATYGHTMAILPRRTACFRCYLADLPPPGSVETCETAGVLAPAVQAIAAFAAMEGLKVLSGRLDAVCDGLHTLDLWTRELRRIAITPDPECRACSRGEFDFLAGGALPPATALCGREAVQVRAPDGTVIDLDRLTERLRATGEGEATRGPYAVRFRAIDLEATIFPDGRAIVKGTGDPARARSFYARFIGT